MTYTSGFGPSGDDDTGVGKLSLIGKVTAVVKVMLAVVDDVFSDFSKASEGQVVSCFDEMSSISGGIKMLNGIYSGATALDNYSQQQEVISTNLAHLNTPGYRRQFLAFEENISGGDNPRLRPGAKVSSRSTDFAQGVMQQSGRNLDLAIAGDGFFVFEGARGDTFSKNGVLYRSPDGELVNGDGLPILGNGEPINIPQNVANIDLSIGSDGQVSANGQVLGKIDIASFDDPHLLESDSQVYFRIGDATQVESGDATILQGSREMANSHSVTELISMIVGSRGFEAAQKAIRTLSDAMQENIRS